MKTPNEHATVQAMRQLLVLRPLGDDAFAGASGGAGLYGSRARRFGGELLAQALRAAETTVDGRPVHSLHAYFIRPARADADVTYRVRRVRDGRSFAVRNVEGWQDDQLAFQLDASFQVPERGFEHEAAMPEVPGPDDLPDERARFLSARTQDPQRFASWPEHSQHERGPFETRFVEDLWRVPKHPPHMHVWVRLRSPVSDASLMPAMAAYYSDDPIMDNALLPHVGRFYFGGVTTASLDHAMWFHAPFDLGEWHLFAQDSPAAAGARGLTRGLLFTRDGRLVCSVAQEVLMRPSR